LNIAGNRRKMCRSRGRRFCCGWLGAGDVSGADPTRITIRWRADTMEKYLQCAPSDANCRDAGDTYLYRLSDLHQRVKTYEKACALIQRLCRQAVSLAMPTSAASAPRIIPSAHILTGCQRVFVPLRQWLLRRQSMLWMRSAITSGSGSRFRQAGATSDFKNALNVWRVLKCEPSTRRPKTAE